MLGATKGKSERKERRLESSKAAENV